MTTYYIVHRDDIGLIPGKYREPGKTAACATWIADNESDIPTMDDLRQWIRDYAATFPCAIVDEHGNALVVDDRF